METTASVPTAQDSDWSSLPADLLHGILARLPWSSHPSFAATCPHWRSVVSPFYPAWLTPLLLNAVDVGSTNIRYYSPYYHKNFQVADTMETPNSKFCCTNGRHLTICQGLGLQFNVVNTDLVTGIIHDLYPLDHGNFDFVVQVGEDRIFGIDTFLELTIAHVIRRNGDWQHHYWKFSDPNTCDPVLVPSQVTNPVYHHNLLYLLAIDGRLVVYDDQRHEEGLHVLENPKGFGFECANCYLFESDDGKLMTVLMDRRGSSLRILKLNEERMEWEKVESLEGRTLFTGTLTTMMMMTDIKWMQNKVILPRLYDWPEIILADLVDREGELAFVPKSSMVSQCHGACGNDIWTCGFGYEEPKEFWETINLDFSIWVDLKD